MITSCRLQPGAGVGGPTLLRDMAMQERQRRGIADPVSPWRTRRKKGKRRNRAISHHSQISPTERARRRDGLDSVIGTMAASGESIPADTLEIFEQYVRGEITAKERDTRVLALIDAHLNRLL